MNNPFATGSWIGGAYIPNQPAAVESTTSTTDASSSFADMMSSMMGSMMSNSQTPSVTMPSQMDVNTLAQAITSNSGSANINLPFGQQAKGLSCNSYNKINKGNYGKMWG